MTKLIRERHDDDELPKLCSAPPVAVVGVDSLARDGSTGQTPAFLTGLIEVVDDGPREPSALYRRRPMGAAPLSYEPAAELPSAQRLISGLEAAPRHCLLCEGHFQDLDVEATYFSKVADLRRSWGDDSLCQTPQYRNNMRKYDPVHLCVFCSQLFNESERSLAESRKRRNGRQRGVAYYSYGPNSRMNAHSLEETPDSSFRRKSHYGKIEGRAASQEALTTTAVGARAAAAAQHCQHCRTLPLGVLCFKHRQAMFQTCPHCRQFYSLPKQPGSDDRALLCVEHELEYSRLRQWH